MRLLIIIFLLTGCEPVSAWEDVSYDMSPNESFALSGAPDQ